MSNSPTFPAIDVSLHSRFPSYRLTYFFQNFIEIIEDVEPGERAQHLEVLSTELNSFEHNDKVINIVKILVAAILVFDQESVPQSTKRIQQEDCLDDLRCRLENWIDILCINSPPQMWYVLENMQDELDEIAVNSGNVPEWKKPMYTTMSIAGKKVYQHVSYLLSSEE